MNDYPEQAIDLSNISWFGSEDMFRVYVARNYARATQRKQPRNMFNHSYHMIIGLQTSIDSFSTDNFMFEWAFYGLAITHGVMNQFPGSEKMYPGS